MKNFSKQKPVSNRPFLKDKKPRIRTHQGPSILYYIKHALLLRAMFHLYV